MCSVECSTVKYSTVQYSTVQYSTVQYSTVQYSIVQYSTAQHSMSRHVTTIKKSTCIVAASGEIIIPAHVGFAVHGQVHLSSQRGVHRILLCDARALSTRLTLWCSIVHRTLYVIRYTLYVVLWCSVVSHGYKGGREEM